MKMYHLLFILFLPVFFLTSCALLTPHSEQKNLETAQEEMHEFIDKFQEICVGRDVIEDPYPPVGEEYAHVTMNLRGEIGQCVLTEWDQGLDERAFNKAFFLYGRWDEFISIIKSRFGVIYHGEQALYWPCRRDDLHDFVLRNGTHLTVELSYSRHGRYCDDIYKHGVIIKLSEKGFYSSSSSGDGDILKRIDVLNINFLTDLEKKQIAMHAAQLSGKEKIEKTQRIAEAIKDGQRWMDSQVMRSQEERNVESRINRRARAQKEAFWNQVNNQLSQGLIALQGQLAEKQQRDYQNTLNNLSDEYAPQVSTQQAPVVDTSDVFRNTPGFDAGQLGENIRYKEETNNNTDGPDVQEGGAISTSSQEPAQVKRKKGKIYEPIPQVSQRVTDTWFNTKASALAYARLKAVNEISDVCREKDAKTDAISFLQIKKEIAPGRWNFSSEQCRQGGWRNERWKCDAEVSGTCFRNQ